MGNYALKSDETNKNQKTQLTESPEIQYEAHKVSYVVEANGYTGYTLPTEMIYRTGTEYTIVDPLTPTAGSGYKFTGWCTDNTYATEASGTKEMGTANVTYYGKFEKNEVTVDLSKFVQKKLELTGVTELPAAEVFTVTLTEGSTTYTATTDAIKSTPDANNLPTFKNGLQSVTLSVGKHIFKVKETADRTEGMTYDPEEYELTVTVNANAMAAANTVIIENKYKPADSDGFTLADKFQKTLVSNVDLSKLPANANSFELKIWEGTDATADAKATGTATINSLTKDERTGKYIGSANFDFGNTVLTFTEAKEYTYTVKETVGTVAGMQYDTNTYTLTITVVNNNGKFEVRSATIGSTNMKDGGPLTITNTFTAAELPLDPTPDPEDNTKVIPKIVKELKFTGGTEKTKGEMKFTVTVKDANGAKVAEGKATVPADSTDGKQVPFTDLGTLVFTTEGKYIYTIKETKGSIPGVQYDEKTYTLTVDVVARDNKLVVDSARYSDDSGVGSTTNIKTDPITITNIYTEPTYAVTKSVVENPSIVPTGVDKTGYQYPTGGKFIVEKTYTDDTITFLYVIEVSGKNGAEMTIQETDDGKFIGVDYSEETRATITLNAAQDTYTIKLTSDVDANDPIKLYAEKTFTKVEGKFPTTATNALLVNGGKGPEQNTTIIERGSAVIDFSKMVQKHLTATGNGTVSEVTFYVDVVGGLSNDAIAYALPEETIPDTYRLVLMATFNNVTGNGYDEMKSFEGAIGVNQAGKYIFKLTERTDAAQTSITYDETEYLLYVYVEAKADGSLEVTDWRFIDSNSTEHNAPEMITFHNTIDTGKDDYYPIIIPTIIGKDTGMLNKTDHFAYVIGYPDGTVHPNGQITRAEVATIFFRLLRDEVRDGAFTTSNSYSDVAYGKWYNNPISTMSALGIITGYPDGTFKPNKPITRAEFAAIAARFDETQSGKSATFSDVIGHWAAKEIGIAYYNDWIKGYPDGTFKPDQNITRAEAMTLINRVLERKPESPADLLTDMNTWTDNMDTSKWYYLDVQEATNSHGYTRKTFNYELWRQMLTDPDWSRYER